MRLVTNGQEYPLSQIAPEFVVLKSPSRLPVGHATIIMSVDGEERQWEVTLLEMDGPTEFVPIQAA